MERDERVYGIKDSKLIELDSLPKETSYPNINMGECSESARIMLNQKYGYRADDNPFSRKFDLSGLLYNEVIERGNTAILASILSDVKTYSNETEFLKIIYDGIDVSGNMVPGLNLVQILRVLDPSYDGYRPDYVEFVERRLSEKYVEIAQFITNHLYDGRVNVVWLATKPVVEKIYANDTADNIYKIAIPNDSKILHDLRSDGTLFIW